MADNIYELLTSPGKKIRIAPGKQIIEPSSNRIPVWGKKRLMLPTPISLADGVIRIYLGFCKEDNVGRVGYVEVESSNPANVLKVSDYVVMDIGEPGTFDENGAVPISIVRQGKQLLLYYGGFQLGYGVKYYMFQGLAESTDNGDTFRRVTQAPILDRTDLELHFRVASFVMQEDGIWKMWYVGGRGWLDYNGKKFPVYRCYGLQSKDYLFSERAAPHLTLDFQSNDEHGFSRPCVVKNADGLYIMFLSVRTLSVGYKLALAVSKDGVNWQRADDKLFFDGLVNDICYPYLYKVGSKMLMFYCGDGYGEGGIYVTEIGEV